MIYDATSEVIACLDARVATARIRRRAKPLRKSGSRLSNARNQNPAVAIATPDTHAAEVRTPSVSSDHALTHELTTATSLDELFKAILGDQAGEVDDRALLIETVEAQVRVFAIELGYPSQSLNSRRQRRSCISPGQLTTVQSEQVTNRWPSLQTAAEP